MTSLLIFWVITCFTAPPQIPSFNQCSDLSRQPRDFKLHFHFHFHSLSPSTGYLSIPSASQFTSPEITTKNDNQNGHLSNLHLLQNHQRFLPLPIPLPPHPLPSFSHLPHIQLVYANKEKGDIPSFKLYESASVLAFLDINPLSKGHALVIPKYHGEKLVDIPDEELGEILVCFSTFSSSSFSIFLLFRNWNWDWGWGLGLRAGEILFNLEGRRRRKGEGSNMS